MPYYDYVCPDCGPFTEIRPMAESAEPAVCPGCGGAAPRAFLSAPRLAIMAGERRQAFATNERSANAPRSSGEFIAEQASRKRHGVSCSCCSGSTAVKSKALRTADGSKTFPGKRPWMISH